MRRNLSALANQSFDLLVIGGGIHGACVAWEATLRGLSVALVEQADFASGTSANSLKVIHGGLRYLQTADFQRMRQSIKERQTLMRIAPHLVHPMPVLVPTYGHSIKGKEAMAVAMKLNDIISGDRNLPLQDPQKHIPSGETLSKAECLNELPDLPTQGLTGAARFHDAQVYNSEQLVLAFIHSAAERGAQIANYTRVTGFCKANTRVIGATAQDQLTGNRFTIQAKNIINASGPWIDQLISTATGRSEPPHRLAKAINLVTRRPLFGHGQSHAIGITGRAPGSRLFFIAPWRGKSLVGTWYGPDNEAIRPPIATTAEITDFIKQINQSYPSFDLTLDDVEWVHTGLLPSDGVSSETGDMKLTSHFQFTDHQSDGLRGLLSVMGVKYTTARDLARKAVDWVFRDRDQTPVPSLSHQEPLKGGHIDQFQSFLNTAVQTYGDRIPAQAMQRLVYNYGSAYPEILKEVGQALDIGLGKVSNHDILAAEVRYSLNHTMPQTLSDVIFRRTELGAAGHPGDEAIQSCARVMATELGWTQAKQQQEIEQVQAHFPSHRPPLPTSQLTKAAC